jgi:2-polyprenyl-3-methyl-5-hydroxy-6-metoxy-1,4-benzoquinol methylase
MAISSPSQPAIDEARVEEFANRIVTDLSATVVSTLASIGDNVGLWDALAGGGPATSAELAARTGAVERYVREWCAAMASAGYIEYDPETERFELPIEHALVLVDPSTPAYLGGTVQLTRGMAAAADGVESAFRNGGGVSIDEYDGNFWTGLERSTGTSFDHGLVQSWVPSIEGLHERLQQGALVADVGCGTGRALIRLAEAYPNSRFHGYDVAEAAVEGARAAVEAAGVDDRVEIRLLDASAGLPERYEVICTFDVVHDASDPRGVLAAVRGGLQPDGVYICLEIASEEQLEDNVGPMAALKYGFSVLYCMTTSLAKDGAGLGTCGVPEGRMRELALEAGFTTVRKIAEDPFSNVYEVRP